MSRHTFDRNVILERLRTHERDLRRRRVASLALFGSVARGEARPDSDVDLLVTFSRPVGLFEFQDLQDYLEELLETNIDLVTESALHERLRERILSEAVRAA